MSRDTKPHLHVVEVQLEKWTEFPIGKSQFEVEGRDPELRKRLQVELDRLKRLGGE
jgi:hypothetical protein